MSQEETTDTPIIEVPETWTVADGQVYATLSPSLTILVTWRPAGQEDPAGFDAELYYSDNFLASVYWEWEAPNIAEFIQVVSPHEAFSELADTILEEAKASGVSLPVELAPSRWERVKPALAKAWALTTIGSLWTADRLIDLMLVIQAGQRRFAPTKRRAWPKGLKERLMRRQRNLCVYCGRRYSSHYLDIDHMDPVAYGGSNDESNLQVLCGPCNRRKGDQTDREFRNRYRGLVPSGRRTPPPRPVKQSQFDAITRRTGASRGLQQRRKLRYLTAREKITTGSLVCGFVAMVLAYLGLDGLGLEGSFGAYPAAIVGLAVGAGLWLRARFTGALYM